MYQNKGQNVTTTVLYFLFYTNEISNDISFPDLENSWNVYEISKISSTVIFV